MKIRPIDIARKLRVSTSALRHYESWGIVPPAPREPNGYRIYTKEHMAYFECIRAMIPGFGMDITKKVMLKIKEKAMDDALWLVNEQQARLHQDKRMAEKTIRVLETEELDKWDSRRKRKWMTIGEVSFETGVPRSAIRHWEKEGLITLPRDQENGYRKFNRAQVRQILMIRTLRSAGHPLEVIRHVMKELDHNHIENARRIARESLAYLNHLNRSQIRGVHYLYQLCQVVGLFQNGK
ncbi:MerR family transcriptional regulator [Thermoflavimicrobium daqui]|jgi:DNA-binding transcriptional MerR regulator|uniref:Transcriptional regulator n=1 Tax=Thermoflavimicrobium daqui TaxID=2137476 RepID=A0A364K488_9BACL|nr:MerR family transcriptional regulator [Thermoflavimicrobium daqui]RAL24183.1 transcriptional regulator [Thermoflavimicrobium daqui]